MDNNYKFNFKIASLPSAEYVYENALFVNSQEYETMKIRVRSGNQLYAKIRNFIFLIKPNDKVERGSIAIGKIFRGMIALSGTGNVDVDYVYDTLPQSTRLASLKFDIILEKKSPYCGMNGTQELDEKEIDEYIRSKFSNSPINYNHLLYIEHGGAICLARAKELNVDILIQKTENIRSTNVGCIMKDTELEFDSTSKELKIISSKMKMKKLTKDDFNFEDMGVGGLKKEFSDIFRIAFASRRYPASYLEKYGISHVKGMLLYGPPGTGKTLIARTLAKCLNAEECKVVNGPELFDKYVGETERKIRELFQKAEEDQKQNGDDSGLHVIVFDEIDSICRQRGAINSGTGVRDDAVNQLLTKIDGVESLNNILVIGMTNRKDLIDEAILRPGRLELHVEIGLPDDNGRMEILKIHTNKMQKNNILEKDVDLEKLSSITKNFTGADLETLVKRASSYALNAGIDLKSNNVDLTQIRKISMGDFLNAFKEIKPQFGSDNSKLENCLQYDIIDYGNNFEDLNSKLFGLLNQVKNSKSSNLLSVLLEGESGVGKTAIACNLALKSESPFIKMISPETLVNLMENGKVAEISRIFEDAYKSPFSIIILDNLERLIEYIKIGPRFSNLVLQTLLVYIKKNPPTRERKIMIIGTTNIASRLDDLELCTAFNLQINIPCISNKKDILNIMENMEGTTRDKQRIADLIDEIPIKKLLMMLDMTRQLSSGPLTFEDFSTAYQYFNSR